MVQRYKLFLKLGYKSKKNRVKAKFWWKNLESKKPNQSEDSCLNKCSGRLKKIGKEKSSNFRRNIFQWYL